MESIAYHYGEFDLFDGIIELQKDPRNPGSFLIPPRCVQVAPPACDDDHVIRWTGTDWEIIEDHRPKRNPWRAGTPFWLPEEGDTYYSEERYRTEPGPLPKGAVTARPEKSEQEQLQDTILESESYLKETDYRVIKFMDKYIQEHPEALEEFASEYPDTLSKRQEARAAINGAQATALSANISLS